MEDSKQHTRTHTQPFHKQQPICQCANRFYAHSIMSSCKLRLIEPLSYVWVSICEHSFSTVGVFIDFGKMFDLMGNVSFKNCTQSLFGCGEIGLCITCIQLICRDKCNTFARITSNVLQFTLLVFLILLCYSKKFRRKQVCTYKHNHILKTNAIWPMRY